MKAFLPLALTLAATAAQADIPQQWSCTVVNVFYTNSQTGAFYDPETPAVGKRLEVNLQAGTIAAPDGPSYYEFMRRGAGSSLMTFDTDVAEGTAKIIDLGPPVEAGNDMRQFMRVFMLEQSRGTGTLTSFLLMLPGEVASGLCKARAGS
ncbi:MAG: hypothetical protein AAGL89_16825 [Pseudomonadota bacterium]